MQPIERDPRAGQVEMIGRAKETSPAIGEAGRHVRQTVTKCGEIGKLARAGGVIQFFGSGQVAHQQAGGDALNDVITAIIGCAKPGKLITVKPEPGHAGVDMKRGRHRLPRFMPFLCKILKLLDIVDHWRDAMGGIVICLPMVNAAEGQDTAAVKTGVGQCCTQHHRLGKRHHKESPAAGSGQGK